MVGFKIREACREDAAKLVAFMQTITAEPNIYLTNSPGEFKLTPAQEETFIQDLNQADNSVFLVAEAGSEIIGSILLRGGERKAVRHTALLGISVAKGWRGAGVGNGLMKAAIEWAKASGVLERIELNVFTQNAPAIHLYEKYGFVVEGRRRKALYRDGRYHDNFIMALLLEP